MTSAISPPVVIRPGGTAATVPLAEAIRLIQAPRVEKTPRRGRCISEEERGAIKAALLDGTTVPQAMAQFGRSESAVTRIRRAAGIARVAMTDEERKRRDRERTRRYRAANREECRRRDRERYANDPEYRARSIARSGAYRKEHRERENRHQRERYANDPEYREYRLASARAYNEAQRAQKAAEAVA